MKIPRGSPRNKEFISNTKGLVKKCAEILEERVGNDGVTMIPTPMPITKIDVEAKDVATIWINVPHSVADNFSAGQYFMCWNPYDSDGQMDKQHICSEKPYSVGVIEYETDYAKVGFTVKNLGRQSGELIKLSVGDWLSIRGPFGNGFPKLSENDGQKIILVSGGIGSTPMHMAASAARASHGKGIELIAIMGFQNADDVHYVERMEDVCDKVYITTDDGSIGTRGFPTVVLEDILSNNDVITSIYTCGPEPMMKAVIDMAAPNSKIHLLAAMERYLPCSMAVCGLCMVGDKLTCKDGPVMDGRWLLKQSDFGMVH